MFIALLIMLLLTLSPALSADCGSSDWDVRYNPHNCDLNNGEYRLTCQSKTDEGQCGMRLDYEPRLTIGTYTATIKAIPGEGTNTAFYLYSYGRDNDQNNPWNEIDIEILGKQIYGGRSRIFTNVWTGFHNQHYEFIDVDWDASNGYHTYTINIDNRNIYWIFDGQLKRTFDYTQFSDLVSTINNKDFQGHISLWGTTGTIDWPDMGLLQGNSNNFPLYAYFKDISMSIGGPSPGDCNFGEIESFGGKCLDIDLPQLNDNGGKVHIWDCGNNINQRWCYDSSTKQIKSEGGKCLDVHNDDYKSGINGATLQIWDCNGWDNQKWTVNGNMIKSNNGKCLDIDLPQLNTNGGKVQLWDCGGANNQLWTI